VHKISSTKQSNKRKYSLSFIIALTVTSLHLSANQFSINYSQLEQLATFRDDSLRLNPSGAGAAVSFELSQDWNIAFNYQAWQDDGLISDVTSADADIHALSGSISYYQNDWFVSSILSSSKDKLLIKNLRHSNNLEKEVNEINSLSILSGYSWQLDNWLYDISLGMQYNRWDINTEQRLHHQDQINDEIIIESSTDNSTAINLSTSLNYLWPLEGNNGILTGMSVSWVRTISGNENQDSGQQGLRTTSRFSSNTNRQSTNSRSSLISSSDSSYGQVSLFLSYDLNENWAIDFDISTAISSDENSQSWSIGTAYYF